MRSRRRHQKRIQSQSLKHPCADLAALWGSRILLDLGCWKSFFNAGFHDNRELMLATVQLDQLDDEISKNALLQEIKNVSDRLEAITPEICTTFQQNIRNLEKTLGFSKTESRILEFAVVLESHAGLNAISDKLGSLATSGVIEVLSIVLDLPIDKVKQALSTTSPLACSGILSLSQNGMQYLDQKLVLLDELSENLFLSHSNTLDMLKSYFYKARAGDLVQSDYDYLSEDYYLIKQYLTTALKAHTSGVNILIHGKPGTGKTELVKVLAQDLAVNLYEISVTDDEGGSLKCDRRFTSYQLSQQILANNKKALIMFDEVEDVFPDTEVMLFGGRASDNYNKAWINRLLEQNKVPALWISNKIDQIDPAYIRRFDYVLKIESPPRRVRQRILSKYLNNLPVSDDWIEAAAMNEALVPALVARASRVVRSIGDDNSLQTEKSLERVLNNTLRAMGYTSQIVTDKQTILKYRLDVLSPDKDVERLVAGLKKYRQGRLCLYGPPGTGKSALGQYIAYELEQPLIVKRASDLLDKYVGNTEMKIAEMFWQASQEQAVLLLDEADSFLRDRTLANSSWEVTQVNELLTQMEGFTGLFVCSTNLMENLDDAALRRFDFKIRLDYLLPEQSWQLFCQVLDGQDQAELHDLTKQKLAQYDNLTPGDYANVVRQCRLTDEPLEVATLLQKLGAESLFKKGQHHKAIGFMAQL